jgi:transposase
MLVGERSRLPIFQIVYNGALKDVRTLKTTLSKCSGLNLKNISVIMDKGFASKENIDAMLSDKDGIRFLAALPFTMKFSVSQVESEHKDIDSVENTINIGEDVIRAATKVRSLDAGNKVFTHIYYNSDLAYHKRNLLYGHVGKLNKIAHDNPESIENDEDYKKYLIKRKSDKSGHTISIRQDVTPKKLQLMGWMVAVSNFISDPTEAISVYRAKDVLEKGFLRLKNGLDLPRLRVHGDNCMQNKIFVGFIALILISHIHKVMDENDLYAEMTMKKMFRLLETLRVQYIGGKRVLYPLTSQHKMIFKAFGIEEPL